ncbi:MAG TPA: hypothetical protein VEI97_07815 [bacterium]|nr:hypothetical protein [bacterium]
MAPAPTSPVHPVTGQPLTLISRKILAPGVHTAAGFGVALFAPAGTTRDTLATAPYVGRFFLTPLKTFPLLVEQFQIPELRCRGGGVTVTAAAVERPTLAAARLRETASFVPIPWPEGTAGYVEPSAGEGPR